MKMKGKMVDSQTKNNSALFDTENLRGNKVTFLLCLANSN